MVFKMINFIKGAIKRAALKLATDKSLEVN